MPTRHSYVTVAALLAMPSAARAQTAVETGWALDRFDPPPVGDGFLLAEHPRYARSWGIAAGLIFEHAASPLTLTRTYADTHVDRLRVVSAMFVGQVGASASFAGRVGVDFVLPVSVTQSGTDAVLGTVVLAPANQVLAGDARIGARLRFVGRADVDPISLHAGVWLWMPTGSRSGNTGDGIFRVEPRLITAGSAGIFRWSLGVSLMFRRSVDALNLAVGNELRFTAAVGFDLLRRRLRVGPEVYIVTPLRNLPDGTASATFAAGQWGGEALAGAHFAVGAGFFFGAGGGVGFQSGAGVPAGRFVLSFTWRGPSSDVGAATFGDP